MNHWCADVEPPAAATGVDAIKQLLPRFAQVRTWTDRLAAPLSAEDCCVQSMPDASPTKWHLAHTTWFFEQFVLQTFVEGYEPFHPGFAYLFNSYYDAVGQRHPRHQRGLLSRPSLEEVRSYRRAVDDAITELLTRCADLSPEQATRLATVVEIGLHHEQQHQELLLTDILHALSCHPLQAAYSRDESQLPFETMTIDQPGRWLPVAGGLVLVGHSQSTFSYDNEMPRHQVYLQPFALAGVPVSCGQWIEFINDGGYQRPELWLSDGWAEVQRQGWLAPLYWQRERQRWTTFTLQGRRDVCTRHPVTHISFYEADAFARWAGARLPTEQEWEHTCVTHQAEGVGFLNVVWQWTGSAYRPYPGYQTPAGALGEYNGKFMSGQMVLRGGSCATPGDHIRPTYRNFFPPAARWQFSGLRLARDL